MARIDIRDDENQCRTTQIVYGSGEALIEDDTLANQITIYSRSGNYVPVYKDEIEYFVKALDKAKELGWFD